MPPSRLYHNPRCSKSRASLELIRARGVDIKIIDYLSSPPSSDDLQDLIALLHIRPRELLRTGEPEYASLGLDRDLDDAVLIDAMSTHPKLIERPIFVHGARAVIGRPPERVLELLG